MERGHYFVGSSLRFAVDAEDDLRRLREALGQLAQVNQLCVLLGAGASVHLGAPMIRKMDYTAITSMCTASRRTLSEPQQEILATLVPAEVDVERLLGQLAASLHHADAYNAATVDVGGLSRSTADVADLFEALNVGLAGACEVPAAAVELASPHDRDPWYTHREFLRRLVASRRPEAPRLRVFTTNYDTAVEQTLDDCGVVYFDGFVGGLHRTMVPNSYEQDLYTSAGPRGGAVRVHDVVQLFKLHGSVTWRVEDATSRIGAARIVQSLLPPKPGELAVIYPTPTKNVDVLGHPYADMLRLFSTSLEMPECALVVVGYGFRDEHINRLIYQALLHNSTLQLFVSDPYGVVASAGEDGAVTFAETPIAQLAQVPDARISVLSGPVASFTNLAMQLPDVAERQPAQQRELETRLESALLPSRLDARATDDR